MFAQTCGQVVGDHDEECNALFGLFLGRSCLCGQAIACLSVSSLVSSCGVVSSLCLFLHPTTLCLLADTLVFPFFLSSPAVYCIIVSCSCLFILVIIIHTCLLSLTLVNAH